MPALSLASPSRMMQPLPGVPSVPAAGREPSPRGGTAAAAALLALLQRIRSTKGDSNKLATLVRDGELRFRELRDLSALYGAAVNVHKCMGASQDCELCLKHLRTLCALCPSQAREFHNRQRAFGLGRTDARMYEARAAMEAQLGDKPKALKMLHEGVKNSAQPAFLLEQALVSMEKEDESSDSFLEIKASPDIAAPCIHVQEEKRVAKCDTEQKAYTWSEFCSYFGDSAHRIWEDAVPAQAFQTEPDTVSLELKPICLDSMLEGAMGDSLRGADDTPARLSLTPLKQVPQQLERDQRSHSLDRAAQQPQVRRRLEPQLQEQQVSVGFVHSLPAADVETCSKIHVHRQPNRVWDTVQKLLEARARRGLLFDPLVRWKMLTADSRRERSEAYFDAMGEQVRSAKLGRQVAEGLHALALRRLASREATASLKVAVAAWCIAGKAARQRQRRAEVIIRANSRSAAIHQSQQIRLVVIAWQCEVALAAADAGCASTSDGAPLLDSLLNELGGPNASAHPPEKEVQPIDRKGRLAFCRAQRRAERHDSLEGDRQPLTDLDDFIVQPIALSPEEVAMDRKVAVKRKVKPEPRRSKSDVDEPTAIRGDKENGRAKPAASTQTQLAPAGMRRQGRVGGRTGDAGAAGTAINPITGAADGVVRQRRMR